MSTKLNLETKNKYKIWETKKKTGIALKRISKECGVDLCKENQYGVQCLAIVNTINFLFP
jgi:hypothetical protein